MRINCINNVCNNTKITGKVGKTVQKTVSKPVETTMGMTALSGLYLTLKAVQEKKEREELLKNLGLEQNTKILKNPVFNTDTLKILDEVSKAGDKTFYSLISENAEHVKELKKENNTYIMSAKNKDTEISSTMTVEPDKTFTLTTVKNGEKTTKTDISDNDKINEKTILEKTGDKTVLKQTIKTHKIRNTVETTTFDNENKNQREYYSKIKYSADGTIEEKITGTNKFSGNDVTSYLKSEKDGTVIETTKNGNKFDTYFENYMFNSLQTLTKTQNGKTYKLEMSEVPNVYNSTIIDENGNEKTESIAHKNPDGSVTIEKNLESLDGTKTIYKYNGDENNISVKYQVVSKDGKVLSNTERTFNRINENLAYSSLNGHKYKIETSQDAYTVTDEKTGEKTEIKKDETLFFDEDSARNHDVLDKLSGDMLLDMHNRQYKYHFNTTDGGCSDAYERRIYTPDDVYLFAHEQGHTKDLIGEIDSDYNDELDRTQGQQHRLMNNPKFRKPYEEEREAFMKNFSELEQNYIAYFIDRIDHYRGFDGGAIEMLANANAMTSTGLPYSNDNIAFHYLQKYFPRTIAAAQEILNNK